MLLFPFIPTHSLLPIRVAQCDQAFPFERTLQCFASFLKPERFRLAVVCDEVAKANLSADAQFDGFPSFFNGSLKDLERLFAGSVGASDWFAAAGVVDDLVVGEQVQGIEF